MLNSDERTASLEVLRRRAKELAREIEDEQGAEAAEVVQFRLGGEDYAIESQYVREAFPLKEVTHMPGAPSWIRGVVNVRSQVIAVVDLRPFLSLGKSPFSDTGRLIILQGGLGAFALLTDGIIGVRLVNLEEIHSLATIESGIRSEYIKGVTPERLIILNGSRILEDTRLSVGEN